MVVPMTNREALLEAALASLQDKGYADTTAREVANRAGVSLGAIGYHYGTVETLLDAALAEGVRRWLGPLAAVLSQGQPPSLEELGPALDRLLASLSVNRPLVIAYFEALLRAERSPVLRTALADDFNALRTTLTSGIAQTLGHHSRAASPDPPTAATLIMAAFDGLIIQWLLDPDQLPSGQLIAETLQRAAALAPADRTSETRPLTSAP
jgi:AcrR family transcriptional regulator